ncbi:MAG: phage minor head protein [Actinomycetota bacterium]
MPTSAERRLARLVRTALAALAGTAQGERLRAAIAGGDERAVLAALDFQTLIAALAPAREVIAEATALAGAGEAARLGIGLSFDSVDPRVVGYAEARTGLMVRDITEATRAGVRAVVVASVRDGLLTVDDVAAILARGVGLHARWARAVRAAYAASLRTGLEAGAADPAARARRQAERVSRRLTEARALMIARTETQYAQNAGRWLSWQAGVEAGYIDPNATKVWSARDPCDQCRALDGTRIPWDADFPGALAMPPAHPNCECSAVLRGPLP